MNALSAYGRDLYHGTLRGWNRFWFTPADPATYCLIRLLAGAMMLYTHLVWTLDLEAFFGQTPWLSAEAAQRQDEITRIGGFAFSYLNYVHSNSLLWATHVTGLVVLAMFTLGLFSRVTSVLSFIIVVSYANRVPPALFGLDQTNGMLALYLMIGPSGARYSLDSLIARRRHGRGVDEVPPSVSANIGIRLIQLHLCVIYLFAALGKAKGDSWSDGTAMWGSFSSYEYQSLDMTWMAEWPLLLNLLTHLSIYWELSYWALVWPRLTRPIYIAGAVAVHLGIAFCLGMITFGLAMIFANLAFVSPRLVRAVVERRTLRPVDDTTEPSSASRIESSARHEDRRGPKRGRQGQHAGTGR